MHSFCIFRKSFGYGRRKLSNVSMGGKITVINQAKEHFHYAFLYLPYLGHRPKNLSRTFGNKTMSFLKKIF